MRSIFSVLGPMLVLLGRITGWLLMVVTTVMSADVSHNPLGSDLPTRGCMYLGTSLCLHHPASFRDFPFQRGYIWEKLQVYCLRKNQSSVISSFFLKLESCFFWLFCFGCSENWWLTLCRAWFLRSIGQVCQPQVAVQPQLGISHDVALTVALCSLCLPVLFRQFLFSLSKISSLPATCTPTF